MRACVPKSTKTRPNLRLYFDQNGQPMPVYSGTGVLQLRAALARYVG